MIRTTIFRTTRCALSRLSYQAQSQFRALPYMARQEAVNAKMRTILVIAEEVHHKFKLQPCTLLTVNILDRYLEKRVCSA